MSPFFSESPAQEIRPCSPAVCHLRLRAWRNHHLLVRRLGRSPGPGLHQYAVWGNRCGHLSVGTRFTDEVSPRLAAAAEVPGQAGHFLRRFHQYGPHAGSRYRGCLHGRRSFPAGQPRISPASIRRRCCSIRKTTRTYSRCPPFFSVLFSQFIFIIGNPQERPNSPVITLPIGTYLLFLFSLSKKQGQECNGKTCDS
jgi:hypothetical protein